MYLLQALFCIVLSRTCTVYYIVLLNDPGGTLRNLSELFIQILCMYSELEMFILLIIFYFLSTTRKALLTFL